MSVSSHIVLLGFCVALSGCGAIKKAYEPNPVLPPQAPVMAAALSAPAQTQPRTDGSLWSNEQSLNPFAEDKAFRRGDIVLVRVEQKSSGTKKANTGTSNKSSVSANIKYAAGLEKNINKLTHYTNVAPDGTVGAWEPNDVINATTDKSYKGDGSTERSDALTATVSAVVTEVLANGNLVVYGHQTVQLNNESSVLTVQGIIRPSDIAYDNTIDSTRIANANIQFTGSGVLSDKQHPGWGTRVMDWVWPF